MIPLRDDAPRSITPYITYFLIILNTLAFLFELSLPPRELSDFVHQFGVVPAAFSPGAPALAAGVVSIFTSMFLHATWLHLIANMWALWIFGDNIEDYLGHFRYLLLYLLSGIAASLLHVIFNLGSPIPSVGASGAIAGVMGAYFLLFPAARVLILIPFFWLPAWVVLGYWFVAQFLSGAATSITSASGATSGGGVAFWAHVGGFVAGMTLIKIFPSRPHRYYFEH